MGLWRIGMLATEIGGVAEREKRFIGIGFADRGDAFDFNVSLQDHFKDNQPKLDLGFKEGQTIKLNIGGKLALGGSSPSSYSGGKIQMPTALLTTPVPNHVTPPPATHPPAQDILLDLGSPVPPLKAAPASADLWGDLILPAAVCLLRLRSLLAGFSSNGRAWDLFLSLSWRSQPPLHHREAQPLRISV
ncbi:hypothetical protein GDO81_004085 [Engystomops pustulosus]|uniref:NECAP PHear domain-containing protein n=1 Tax=Engystomops pustulosus TaxID=76066 RepID=A0AAV6ZPU1_ENGPU|nr:hypothetical protein GDO81_004085 [Engystomops pustulosus]